MVSNEEGTTIQSPEVVSNAISLSKLDMSTAYHVGLRQNIL